MADHKNELLDLKGKAVEMLRGGSGPPLLYLHSAGAEGWWPFHDLLASRFDVMAPFHPGYGKSGGGRSVRSVEDVVFHYLDLLDFLELARVNLMGLSLGGWIAAELAAYAPERVARLVLVDAVGVSAEHFDDSFEYFLDPVTVLGYTQDVRARTFCDPESEVARSFVPDSVPLDQIPSTLQTREMNARLAWKPYFHDPRLPGRLHRINCPTLLVWGECDRMVPREVAERYHRLIPGSRLLVMPKAGHVPPIETPKAFAAEAIDFLTRT